MIHRNIIKINVLFIVDGCEECHRWKQCIKRYNILLPIQRRIIIQNCEQYHAHGIDNNLRRQFASYIKNTYPSLFLDSIIDGSGQILDFEKTENTNSRIELESYMKSRFAKYYITPLENEYGYNPHETPQCVMNKTWWGGRKLVCKKE